MLKKLLKYDLGTVMKYWWIAAVTVIGLSVLSGFSISVLAVDALYLNVMIYIIAIMVIFATVLSYSAFMILTIVFIFVRFYKNFFSDEGYLTFTLPVKRSQLLNSKLITAVITTSATTIVTFAGLAALLCIGLSQVPEFWEELKLALGEAIDYLGAYSVIYIVEFILLMFLSTLFSVLCLFNCITFGAVIVKKAKVIAAIGVSYGVSMINSIIVQIVSVSVTADLAILAEKASQDSITLLIALGLFAVILVVGLICTMLYTLQYWMLDKKLNLS